MKLSIGTAQFGEDYGISNNRKDLTTKLKKYLMYVMIKKYQFLIVYYIKLYQKNKKNILKINFKIICKVLIKDKNKKKSFYSNFIWY